MAIVNGTAGNDHLNGTPDSDEIYGLDGDDVHYGSNGNDIVDGGPGNDELGDGNGKDRLNGGDGKDTLHGADGNDSLYGGDGNDYFTVEDSNNLIDGGNGFDTISYTKSSVVNLATGLKTGADGSDSLLNIEAIYSGAYDDTLTGDAVDNTLNGGGGNDTMDGGAGNDGLLGEAGNDSLSGGDGNDSLSGGDGSDTLEGGAGNDGLSGEDGNDFLSGGDGNDDLHGGAGNDTLTGGAGNDAIDGGVDNDSLSGGDGNDNLKGGAGNDTITGGEGNDYIFGEDGSDSLDGGAGNDTIDGGVDNDSLSGADGNDNLKGGAGNDTITGGGGNDFLYGGDGDDSLDGGEGGDYFFGGKGNNTLNGGGGPSDTASYSEATASVSASLVTGIKTNIDGTDSLISIEAITGGAFNDTLTGDAGYNFLNGGGGNDTLDGGAGSDSVHFGGPTGVVVNLAEGISRVMTGGEAVQGNDGTDTLINIEDAIGSQYADELIGSAADNWLEGMGGNDTINGGAGQDTVSYRKLELQGLNVTGVTVNLQSQTATGGAGNDTLTAIENVKGSPYSDTLTGSTGNNIFYATAGNDTVLGGGGDDEISFLEVGNENWLLITTGVTVDLSVGQMSYSLGTMQFSGIAKVTGSKFDDTLTGDANVNYLDGFTGNDTITGGGGNDTIDGGVGQDTVVYALNASNYTVTNITGGYQVAAKSGAEGTDTLRNVESLKFADQTAIITSFTFFQKFTVDPAGVMLSSKFYYDSETDDKSPSAWSDWYTYHPQNSVIETKTNTKLVFVSDWSAYTSPPHNPQYYPVFPVGTNVLVRNVFEAIGDFSSSNEADWHLTNFKQVAEWKDGVNGTVVRYVLLEQEGSINFSSFINITNPWAYNDHVVGSSGADAINAHEGADSVEGRSGNDTLTGGDGNDSIDGGDGQDSATYALNASSYTVTAVTGGYQVVAKTGTEGTDTLLNVESLKFADQTALISSFVSTGTVASTSAKFWKDNTKAPTDTKKADAVNLTDAIAILKMIVGLNVNSNNTPLSPYQAIAADFDQSGDVGLTDAIGVLKMVVGLTAPTPTWKYYDDTKLASAYTSAQSLNPKGWTTTAVISDTGTADSSVKLVGVLTGDVDGSWTGV